MKTTEEAINSLFESMRRIAEFCGPDAAIEALADCCKRVLKEQKEEKPFHEHLVQHGSLWKNKTQRVLLLEDCEGDTLRVVLISPGTRSSGIMAPLGSWDSNRRGLTKDLKFRNFRYIGQFNFDNGLPTP